MNHRSYGLQAASIERCVLEKHSVSVEVLATTTISIQRLSTLSLGFLARFMSWSRGTPYKLIKQFPRYVSLGQGSRSGSKWPKWMPGTLKAEDHQSNVSWVLSGYRQRKGGEIKKPCSSGIRSSSYTIFNISTTNSKSLDLSLKEERNGRHRALILHNSWCS
jgi:hypothetical protein